MEIVGAAPSGLPCFAIPDVGPQDFSLVFPLAVALFLLSYVELTSIARTYAKTRNYEIDTDQELLALGASSIGTGFFQGFPVAGSFSKSAVNDRAGALTPLSGALAGLRHPGCPVLYGIFILSAGADTCGSDNRGRNQHG